MFRKIVAVWVSLAMLFGLVVVVDVITDITPTVRATTLYVNTTGLGGAYTSIQDAINDSNDGDTVFVYSGTYYENIVVNKTINLMGENKTTTIIDGTTTDICVYINSSWVNVTGFTIRNSSKNWAEKHGGIKIRNTNNVTIKDNICTSNLIGIVIHTSDYNTIENNTCNSNSEQGINANSNSDYNFITRNNAKSNKAGIVLYNNCDYNVVSFNNASSNTPYHGINLDTNCDYNIISNNTCNFNQDDGIYLFSNNDYNLIINNTVSFNNNNGIIISAGSYNNRIYHNNIISNNPQASDSSSGYRWDNGYPLGGNYWSDYTGDDLYKGPDQDIPGSDGIGDDPYVIDSNSRDRYPFMEPFDYQSLENYTILKQGWNLISIPLIQENQSIKKVLEMIDGYYDAIQWYDSSNPMKPWKHHKVGKPFGNDLFELNESMGFWIHITHPGDTIFLYNGTQPTSNQSITIHPGWNMVGYPSLINRTRDNALNNLNYGSDVDAIWTFNATTQTWWEIDPSDYFELGRGYWIHSKVTKTWDVPL